MLLLSSESASNIHADMIHYGFTKTAYLSISRGLAKRVAGTGVTVNAILPGPTLSDGLEAMLKGGQKASGLSMEDTAAAFVMKHRPSSIIQRAATVEDVANWSSMPLLPKLQPLPARRSVWMAGGRDDRLIQWAIPGSFRDSKVNSRAH